MNIEDYVKRALQFVKDETGEDLPKGTVILCMYYTDAAGFKEICGLKVMVTNTIHHHDIALAIPSENFDKWKHVNAFNEFLELVPM